MHNYIVSIVLVYLDDVNSLILKASMWVYDYIYAIATYGVSTIHFLCLKLCCSHNNCCKLSQLKVGKVQKGLTSWTGIYECCIKIYPIVLLK